MSSFLGKRESLFLISRYAVAGEQRVAPSALRIAQTADGTHPQPTKIKFLLFLLLCRLRPPPCVVVLDMQRIVGIARNIGQNRIGESNEVGIADLDVVRIG